MPKSRKLVIDSQVSNSHSQMAELQHCQYFVERKKRYCRMTIKNGSKYCGEHLPQDQQSLTDGTEDGSQSRKRVACPLDPTHTCYSSKLAKHLTVCNVKHLKDAQPVYIVEGINGGDVTGECPKHIPLSQLNNDTLDVVLKKIHAAYENLPAIPQTILSHPVLANELNNTTYGKDVRKHLLQNASLIAHLDRAKLVRDNTCFMEFGAGRGKLTYWLAQAMKEQKNSSVLLVDRSSHRHKSDNKLKNEKVSLDVMRIRADIRDLRLSAVPQIRQFECKVGIAKHLCGVATDLTMRCLVGAMQDDPKVNVIGLLVAFCCHHRCEYIPYVGKEYLEKCGFTVEEFPILCSIASWATCGSGKSRVARATEGSVQNGESEEGGDGDALKKRECLGRKVKTLLNWGRVEFLKNAGFECQLLHYTTTDVSLENECILATRESIK